MFGKPVGYPEVLQNPDGYKQHEVDFLTKTIYKCYSEDMKKTLGSWQAVSQTSSSKTPAESAASTFSWVRVRRWESVELLIV